MTAPNILNLSQIYGNTAAVNLTGTLANVVVNNVGSNLVTKINSVTVSNFSANSVTTYVSLTRSSGNYYLAGGIVVPAYSTLIVSGKDTQFYLIEGDQLQANASLSGSATIISSYETIG